MNSPFSTSLLIPPLHDPYAPFSFSPFQPFSEIISFFLHMSTSPFSTCIFFHLSVAISPFSISLLRGGGGGGEDDNGSSFSGTNSPFSNSFLGHFKVPNSPSS